MLNDISCQTCHYNYDLYDTHKNGQINRGASADIVHFNAADYAGSWTYSSCQSLDCHGDADWYSGQELACAACHDSAYSTYYPQPNNMKHNNHLTTHSCTCATCHDGYGSKSTHLDGTSDTANMVTFDDPDGDYYLIWDDSANSCARTGSGCHPTGSSKFW